MSETKAFYWPVRVYYEDTDCGGVVYHSNYLAYMERARTEALRQRGIWQAKWVAQHSLLFAVRHASLEFKRTAKYDDLLAVKTELISSNRLSLHFRQEIYRMRAEMLGFEAGWNMPDGMDELVCEGLVKIVVLSADGMQPKRMSVELLEEIIS